MMPKIEDGSVDCGGMACEDCDITIFICKYNKEERSVTTSSCEDFVNMHNLKSDPDHDSDCYTVYRFMKKVNKLKILEKLT